jgi:hypothetical protein
MSACGVMGAARPPLRLPHGYLCQSEWAFILVQISPPEAPPASQLRAA